jgi:hypothetical protein
MSHIMAPGVCLLLSWPLSSPRWPTRNREDPKSWNPEAIWVADVPVHTCRRFKRTASPQVHTKVSASGLHSSQNHLATDIPSRASTGARQVSGVSSSPHGASQEPQAPYAVTAASPRVAQPPLPAAQPPQMSSRNICSCHVQTRAAHPQGKTPAQAARP